MTDRRKSEFETRKAREIAQGCLANSLRRADRAVMTYYDEALRPFGLRMTQMSLLVALRLGQPVTIQDLARRLVMDRTTLSRNLAPLERRGLVTAAPGADRRTRLVSLTGAGEALLTQVHPEWRKAQARVARRLGKDKVESLMRQLSTTVETLTRE
jgi:DNA-binding MarR family transcriptional regulator